MREQLNRILSEHTHQPFEKVSLDTERDYWMTADEATTYGIVDAILTRRELAAVASR
jgi:ATP-dependent Clp protease protease subunit